MNCPECDTEMIKVYDVEEVEREFKPEGFNRLAVMKAQFELLRNMTCPNCGFTKRLSALEIVAEFKRRQKENGKTDSEISDLVKLKSEEARELTE